MTQQILCVQIPCILVQDNHNKWPMRIYPATIRSYCFLHSLKSLAETNSAKTAKKKTASNVEATHLAWVTAPEVYCQRRYKTHVNATNHSHATFLFNFLFIMDLLPHYSSKMAALSSSLKKECVRSKLKVTLLTLSLCTAVLPQHPWLSSRSTLSKCPAPCRDQIVFPH